MMAAHNGHAETVNELIAAGADVPLGEDAALVLAAGNGHTDTVRALLGAGAGLRAGRRDEARRRALENGHADTVRILKKWKRRGKKKRSSSSQTA